jgi:YVTN family beta-propeller protein
MRRRSTGIAAIILLTLFAIGCGQTYRPVATPILEPGGDPSNLHHAIVVEDNGASRGTASNIDTPGDTNIGNVVVGVLPVHAGFVSNSRTYVANSGDNTVTRYLTLAPSGAPVTIAMPPGCAPRFVMSRDTGTAWVACSGSNQVAVMNVGLDSITTTVAVGANPVALNATIPGNKVYVMNRGAGTVTVFQTVDNVVSATIPVGGAPVWSAMNQDGSLLFVANDSGYISVINVTSDTVTTTIPVGANPDFVTFNANKGRLYVANAGGNSVSVIDAVPTSGTYLTVIATIPVGAQPLSVTALNNGTKVYTANCGANSVSVIDATSLTVVRTITTGTCPVSLDSPTDSTRVVVGVQGTPGGTNFLDPPSILSINTTSDTTIVTLKPAQQDTLCSTATAVNNYCPLQRPVFVVMAP